jgi:hypothetical protein
MLQGHVLGPRRGEIAAAAAEKTPRRRPSWPRGRVAPRPLSTVRESNASLRFGRPGPNRSDNGASSSAHRDSNPAPLTGSQACGHEHLGRVRFRRELHSRMIEVAARRLAVLATEPGGEAERVERGGEWTNRTPGPKATQGFEPCYPPLSGTLQRPRATRCGPRPDEDTAPTLRTRRALGQHTPQAARDSNPAWLVLETCPRPARCLCF